MTDQKDIYFCCDSWPKIVSFLLLLSSSLFISPTSSHLLSVYSSIYSFYLCTVMNFQVFLTCLLFAIWHHMKKGTTTADCDASFIFINQRRDCLVGGQAFAVTAAWSTLAVTSKHSLSHTYSNCFIFVRHAWLFEMAWNDFQSLDVRRKLSFEMTWNLNPRKHEDTNLRKIFF